jgi:hypothetical protein|tara:strand:- start:3622 stop:3834 length:213 start_codon:yes stop_codon:yes gene_type:complete
MEQKITLTREEVSLLIHSVQRMYIKLEQYKDDESELMRKHRLLIGTLLELEKQIINNSNSVKQTAVEWLK